jgi:hypothetical protein
MFEWLGVELAKWDVAGAGVLVELLISGRAALV